MAASLAALALLTDNSEQTGYHIDEPGSKHQLFSTEIASQPDSFFLTTLPPEIRLMIYKWVFTPPYAKKSSLILAILATCRHIHGEAIVMALQKTEFHFTGPQRSRLTSKLCNFGVLQQHIRHVEITMPIRNLDAHSSSNPFILSKLPLNLLKINFGKLKIENRREDRDIYYRFMSAFLYRTTPRRLDETTVPIHETMIANNRRWIEVKTKLYQPQKKDLYHMLAGMKAKRIVIISRKNSNDVIWHAFTYFELIDHCLTILRLPKQTVGEPRNSNQAAGPATKYRIIFFDKSRNSVLDVGRISEARDG